MLRSKLFWSAVVFSGLIASAVSYRLVTGQCPIGAICHYVHGDSKTPAN